MARDRPNQRRQLLAQTDNFWGKDITSTEMSNAIQEWFSLYFQRNPTREEDPCQRLPYAIVNKLCKTVFSEYASNVVDVAVSAKQDWQQKNLDALDSIKKEAMQWALIGGECLLKLVPGKESFTFTVIRRDSYVVLGRDYTGELTDIGLLEFTSRGKFFYTLLERRRLDNNGMTVVDLELHRSPDRNKLGGIVPLASLPAYEHLPSTYTFPTPMNSLGLVRMKTPMANAVDGSHDGMCVYEPAVGLIHNINRNEKLLDKEFENGRSRIVASSDIVKEDVLGEAHVPDDLFIGVPEDSKEIGVHTYTPPLRDENYERRKQSYFRSCETLISLKRGILSAVEAAERTAKEITSSEGDYNLTIIDFQNMWYDAAQEALRVCDVMGQMYGLTDQSAWNRDQLSIEWGNGVLYDKQAQWDEWDEMVASNMLKPEINLAWKYDLPWETEADLALIREKYMPELASMRGGRYDI